MTGDDEPRGHVLTRREVLGLAAAPAVLMLTAWYTPAVSSRAVPGCVVRPEQTEGPYFVDKSLNRSDIRSTHRTDPPIEGCPINLQSSIYNRL
jgi:hypothetical protein